MPSRWKYPRYGEAWAECQTCSQDFPSSQVWLNPRWGFQCYKCWDGLLSRDQILQPIFPGEGTRKTIDPVTNSLLQGAATSVAGLEPTYTYFLRDRSDGTVYEVRLVPFFITNTGKLVYLTSSVATVTEATPGTDDDVWDGIRINGGWSVYVGSGALKTEYQTGNPLLQIVDGICDFGEIPSNCTVYVRDRISEEVSQVNFSEHPPTVTPIIGELSVPIFDAVLVPSGFYVVLAGSLVATLIPPSGIIYSNACVSGVSVFNSSTDQPENGVPPVVPPGDVPSSGGGGSDPWPPVMSCPQSVIDELHVDFMMTTPTGFSIINYHWDFGDGNETDTGPDPSVSHDYAGEGTYFVVVTATVAPGSASTPACPVEVVVGCPAVGSDMTTWGISETLTNATKTLDPAFLKLERDPSAGGFATVALTKPLDSADWGTCTKLVYSMDVRVVLHPTGGIPQSAVFSEPGSFELDCTDSECDQSATWGGQIDAPFAGDFSITVRLNGGMTGYAEVHLNQFELQP